MKGENFVELKKPKEKDLIMEKINLFFAIDDNYCPLLSASVHSILKNANKNFKYDIYVLHNGIGDESQNVMKSII